jgi:hypothetical protein
MQFPITREALQNFDGEAALKAKQKQQRDDIYRMIIQDICKDIETGMMPMQLLPKGSPQNSPWKIQQDSIKNDKKYIWKHIGILERWDIFLKPHMWGNSGNPVEYYKFHSGNGTLGRNMMRSEDFNQSLPEFIELLKETFVGCDIIVDPLKTYLIIDWS